MKGRFLCVLLLGICQFGFAAVSFRTPAAGVSWKLATRQTISWLSTEPLGGGILELYQSGNRIGRLQATVPLGDGEQATTWVVGELSPMISIMAGTYTLRLNRWEGGPLIAESASFSIGGGIDLYLPPRLFVRLPFPPPLDCPSCGIFELEELQKCLASLPEQVKVMLAIQGRRMASLGFSGKGVQLPAKAKILLPDGMLAALRKGAVMGELKLLLQNGKLLLSHPLQVTPID